MTDIDTLLDSTLDDLADIPEFKPFPVGAHRCTINWDIKEINGKKCPELKLTAVETVELSETNPEGTLPLNAGDTTNVLFQLVKKDGTANDIGQGQFKETLKPLAAHFNTVSPKDTMAASNGAECLVVTTIQEDNRDKNNIKHYTKVTNIQVL